MIDAPSSGDVLSSRAARAGSRRCRASEAASSEGAVGTNSTAHELASRARDWGARTDSVNVNGWSDVIRSINDRLLAVEIQERGLFVELCTVDSRRWQWILDDSSGGRLKCRGLPSSLADVQEILLTIEDPNFLRLSCRVAVSWVRYSHRDWQKKREREPLTSHHNRIRSFRCTVWRTQGTLFWSTCR